MLPSQNLQDRGLPCDQQQISKTFNKNPSKFGPAFEENYLQRGLTSAIGSDKKATITSVEGEGEILDKGVGTGRRVAVDSRVSESEAVDDDGGVERRLHDWHFAEWRIETGG